MDVRPAPGRQVGRDHPVAAHGGRVGLGGGQHGEDGLELLGRRVEVLGHLGQHVAQQVELPGEALLAAGRTRWLPFATREVEQVLGRLRQSALERSLEVAGVAAEWGTSEDATLKEIITHAPSTAWKETFTSHLQALNELAGGIAALRDSNLP